MRDKVARLPELAERVASVLGAPGLTSQARLVAARCKLDLGTELVRDFPELHGLLGAERCLARGDSDAVAVAVASHLRPRDDADLPPEDLLGALVCVADRVDTLAGAFAHGLAPTPSQDPLNLRARAYGLLRTLLAHDLRVDLRHLAELAVAGQSASGSWLSPEDVVIRMTGFLRHRLKVLLGRTFSAEEVHGAVSLEPLCPASALASLGSGEPRRV
jgi:glycyl-tRNA synthetase beta chain